ncbi:hypothetical protein B6D19_04310 [Gilliamella apicola]|uniref:hypothetical protein n=1 Tax=Gilliamella apicola TaxID=1196095 RepID=UPI000A3568FC|nr:hypothetical protein [Gilliamella apicola]OTQ32934.1 hypothetical protein B6D19_04310 [Gilliamella apicola]OTQ34296.1 hypothetical protein B6D20_13145 [Gilliamella apicola]
MKNESFEFMSRLCVNFSHNHNALAAQEMNLIILLLNVAHKKQLDQYWYHSTIYISTANILSIISQLLNEKNVSYVIQLGID